MHAIFPDSESNIFDAMFTSAIASHDNESYDLGKLRNYLRENRCPFWDDISDMAIMNGVAQIQQGRAFGYAEYEIIDLTLGVLPSSIMARLILEFFDEGATEISSSYH